MGTGPRGTELSYGLLGPLEIRHGDAPVRLADDRQRHLLALLLLGANRPVSAWTLIDQLFADAPGRPPFDAVWAQVRALRARLSGDGRTAAIASRPGGYELAVAPEQLDARRFERLLADGCALRRGRRTAEAAAVLREALDLWRGDPLCDLPVADFAQAEIDRLRELHSQALELYRETTATRLATPAPAAVPPAVPVPPAVSAPRERALAEAASHEGSGLPELVARAATGELIGLVGPSGVDRTSVLCEEVLPMLAAGTPPDSAPRRQILIRPGPSPVATLEQALGGPLVDTLVALPEGERLVIAVDRLEELFDDGVEEAERARFLDLLVVAASDPARRAIVIVTVGAERCGRFSGHSRFAQRLNAAHHLLGTPSPAAPHRVTPAPTEQTDVPLAPAPALTRAAAPPRLVLAPPRPADRRPTAAPARLVLAPPRPARRRPTAALALAVVLLGLLIVAGAVAMAGHHRSRDAPREAQRAPTGNVRRAGPATIVRPRPSLARAPARPPDGRTVGAPSRCMAQVCGH